MSVGDTDGLCGKRSGLAKRLTVLLLLISMGMIGMGFLPPGHGAGGWYQIVDVEGETVVQVLSGEAVITRMAEKEDGRTVFHVTGDLTGTLRVFSSNVAIEAGDVDPQPVILGEIDIWTGADNVLVRGSDVQRGGRGKRYQPVNGDRQACG
jgi:hypothetical protein